MITRTMSYIAVSLATLLVACADDPNRLGTKAQEARPPGVSPEDITGGEVTVAQVYLQPADEDAERVVLSDAETTVEFLSLCDSLDGLLAGAAIPAGTYDYVAFVITGGSITLDIDGTSTTFATDDGNLQLPSWASSGLKVKLPGDPFVLDESDTLVDIACDPTDALGHLTGSGKLVMRPVIDAIDAVIVGPEPDAGPIDAGAADAAVVP